MPVVNTCEVVVSSAPFPFASYVTVNAVGVTAVAKDAAAEDAPFRFAIAENLYAVPFVSPDTTHEVAGVVTVHVLAGEIATPLLSSAVTV